MSEAGIVVPEFKWPTTPATFASTSFCATVVPTFGSAWSSSATSTNFASLPSIVIFVVFASSIASRAPFSLSLPRCAMLPVSGATWLIMIVMLGGGAVAVFAASVGAVFAASADLLSALPHAARPSAATTARAIGVVRVSMLCSSRYWGETGNYRDRLIALSNSLAGKDADAPTALFLRQDPLHHRVDLGVRDRRVRRHRDLAPYPHAALLHFLREHLLGILLTAVLRGYVLVGRADQLLVDGMARETGVLLQQVIDVLCARWRSGEDGDTGDRGTVNEDLHRISRDER